MNIMTSRTHGIKDKDTGQFVETTDVMLKGIPTNFRYIRKEIVTFGISNQPHLLLSRSSAPSGCNAVPLKTKSRPLQCFGASFSP
jgi:hypothetical protein